MPTIPAAIIAIPPSFSTPSASLRVRARVCARHPTRHHATETLAVTVTCKPLCRVGLNSTRYLEGVPRYYGGLEGTSVPYASTYPLSTVARLASVIEFSSQCKNSRSFAKYLSLCG